MTFSVHAVSAGRMPLPAPEVFWMSDWDDWFDATFWMLLARDGEHTVVVNTGPPADLGPLNTLWKGFHPSGRVQFSRDESERPENALAALDVDPADVTHVVITPLVAYTLGNLRLFPNAEYVISRRGWVEDVFAPPYPTHVPREIFLPDDVMSYLLFEARDRVRLVGPEEQIVPGLRTWEAGVHHRSSLAVCFDTTAGSVVATDAAFSYRNVEDNVYLGIGESYAEAMATYARLRAEADVVVPLYEPRLLEGHPDGRIG
jgi:hypothetical protein